MGIEKWQTAVKNYTLMPHAHFETGSQDCFVIFTNQVKSVIGSRTMDCVACDLVNIADMHVAIV